MSLQKKRDEFRKEIRKNKLDKYRDDKRKQLFHQQIQISQQILNQIDQNFAQLEQVLAHVAFQKRGLISLDENSAQIVDESIAIKHVITCFQTLKIIAPFENVQVFTRYMHEKKSCQRLMRIFQDLIKNEVDYQNEAETLILQKYSLNLRAKTLLQILKFLDTLSYLVIDTDCISLIIEGLWGLFTDELLVDEMENFAFLNCTLSILSKILEDSNKKLLYNHLVQKGIGNQIVNIIERLRKLKVPLQIHEKILTFLNNYLSCEMTIKPEFQSNIGEITINTSAINEKEILIAYCIVFLEKQEASLYSLILPVISKIIDIHEFLTSSLKDDYLTEICNLLFHSDRNIQVQALNLLLDLTYHSQDCIDYLLEKGYLLNVIHKRLGMERSLTDDYVNSCIEKMAYIICNCLLTQKTHLKQLALGHFIWEDVHMSLHPSSKLFPLIMTMMYFFAANGHKNFEKYMIPYLEALQNFEWKETKYRKEIQRSIENTFHVANQYWQQHELKKFKIILYQHGFKEIVGDLSSQNHMDEY